MTPGVLASAIGSLGTCIVTLLIAWRDQQLADNVRSAFAVAGPLVVAVWAFATHQTEQSKISGGAQVASSKSSAPDISPALLSQAMQMISPAQPPASPHT